MKRSILKPILFGVLFGAAAFFAPFFLLKAILFIFIVSLICRLFWWKRGGWQHRMQYHMAYADKLRGMSEEEYANFKKNYSNDCCDHSCCDWNSKNSDARSGSNETPVENK